MTTQEIQQLNGKLYQECISYALTLTNNVVTARDLVQDAYYKAFKHEQQFEPGTNLRAWIKRIVYNTFASDYRREKRRRELFQEAPRRDHWMVTATTDNSAPAAIESNTILQLVDQLKDIYRRPFLLHLRGMPYDQIGRSFNIPIGTVKSRVFVARQQLRTLVQREYQLADRDN